MSIEDVFVYLRASNAAKAIDFYRDAFGATEKFRLVEPGGRIGHVELAFGGTTVMLSDEFPEYDITAPSPASPAAYGIHLHVDDADAMIDRAVAAGATLVQAPQDHFYGERSGSVRCPFGYLWMIGHEIEKLEPAEMQRRYDAIYSSD